MARPIKAVTKPETAGPVDTTLFTDEELKQLQEEAEAEFALEAKKDAQEAFKASAKRKLREKAMFAAGKDAEGEAVESVTIDLAPHSPWITIDGRVYYHGVTYKFTTGQAATIKEVMFRTWQHEREIGGANINAEMGRTPLNRAIA